MPGGFAVAEWHKACSIHIARILEQGVKQMGIIQFFMLLFFAFIYLGICALLAARLFARFSERAAATDQTP
jgi:hypothetical protein